jgi:hypothetical protein
MHQMGDNGWPQDHPCFLRMMRSTSFRFAGRRRLFRAGSFLALLLLLFAGPVRASVGLLLEMPYGHLGTFNPTGHAALYFDHICAETPLELRPCGPGELGVVISRYDGIGDFDWVAIPLVPYLYGVQSAADIPTTMDALTALRMRDLYRREHLEAVAPDTREGGMPQGNWYELVGSAYDRTIYGFQLNTTTEQDQEVIAYFNDRPNVTRYEGAFRNCADFTRVVLNRLYPAAIRRNYIADFGLTTPKSVARGLVHYGRKHPELELSMFRVPQVQGTIPRSMSIQGVTGSLLTRYGVPMAVLAPHVTAVVLVAYIGKGRFAVPKAAPVLDVAAMEQQQRAQSVLFVASSAGSAKGLDASPEMPSTGISTLSYPASLDAGFEPALFDEAVPFLP